MLITIWTSSSTKRLANWECAAVNFNVCNMKSKHKIKFQGKLRKLNICLNYTEEINYINMFRKKKKKHSVWPYCTSGGKMFSRGVTVLGDTQYVMPSGFTHLPKFLLCPPGIWYRVGTFPLALLILRKKISRFLVKLSSVHTGLSSSLLQ